MILNLYSRFLSVLLQEAAVGVLSKGTTGTAPLSSKLWRDEPAAKTGRGASATRGGRCSALST